MNDMATSERARRWASTMAGHEAGDLRLAHAGAGVSVGEVGPLTRQEREETEDRLLAAGATRASGAGHRAPDKEAESLRTRLERDRAPILPSRPYRTLAGHTHESD